MLNRLSHPGSPLSSFFHRNTQIKLVILYTRSSDKVSNHFYLNLCPFLQLPWYLGIIRLRSQTTKGLDVIQTHFTYIITYMVSRWYSIVRLLKPRFFFYKGSPCQEASEHPTPQAFARHVSVPSEASPNQSLTGVINGAQYLLSSCPE